MGGTVVAVRPTSYFLCQRKDVHVEVDIATYARQRGAQLVGECQYKKEGYNCFNLHIFNEILFWLAASFGGFEWMKTS